MWMRAHGKESINPLHEAEQKWTTHVHELASKTLFPKTKSW